MAVGPVITNIPSSSIPEQVLISFPISFTQSVIGEKRFLTLWVRCDGILSGRLRVSILTTAASGTTSGTTSVVTISLNQFVHGSDNAVDALPHVGPYPILKTAWLSLQTWLLKHHISQLREAARGTGSRVCRGYNILTMLVTFQVHENLFSPEDQG